MGGHDHHHGPPYKVPSASIYKVADAPPLLEVEKSLARQGLKDPWLRNEVWRYTPNMGSHRQRVLTLLFRGLPYGFAAFVATIGIEKAFGVDWHDPRGLHHGHGEHGGDHH